jgi:23S rRNA (uracil1939-C5)-methyltransferase
LRELMQEGALPDEARYFRAIAGDDEVSITDDVVGRAEDISHTINGERYRANADSFFQTNVDLLPQLVEAAIGAAHGEKAFELYCGVGLFTVPLARRFKNVVGIEGDGPATDFARRNLAEAGLANAKVVNQNVANWLEQNLECADNDDALGFLLLDPPRTGAESRVINGILNLKPKKICYVSCDPATLARDLKKLIAGGYAIENIAAFDMFPQTHHVETVVHLSST